MGHFEPRFTMSPSVQELLRRKGGVGLLVVLNERGKIFSEIESEVAVSSSTLSTRLDEALEIGFIEMTPAKHRGRTRTEYTLTSMGERLVRQLSMEGVVSNYQAMRTHQEEMKAGTEAVIDWVQSNPSQIFDYPESFADTMIYRDEEDGNETESVHTSEEDGSKEKKEDNTTISNSEEYREAMPEFIDDPADSEEGKNSEDETPE